MSMDVRFFSSFQEALEFFERERERLRSRLEELRVVVKEFEELRSNPIYEEVEERVQEFESVFGKIRIVISEPLSKLLERLHSILSDLEVAVKNLDETISTLRKALDQDPSLKNVKGTVIVVLENYLAKRVIVVLAP
ncbi:MAG: hypothetical protein DRJ40_05835 [Thermoprotei archaeon]|nr:MAG: hypothetical protein DRJ40_05835 [Thermoprotei archaeon]